MRSVIGVTIIGALALSSACAPKDYVKSDVALGRVVVYRNGVAYYERRARVEKEQLTVHVPADKVDDFLKSLTVLDAQTGKPFPVSFPRQDTIGSGLVDMTISLPKTGAKDVLLTYITEAPAWKPSYRVVVQDDGKVLLQGWAIVDNTSGEDWNDIWIGVGSSSAMSFRYDLWSVRTVQREVLATEERFAVAPPMGGSPYRESGATAVAVLGEITEAEVPRPPGHPEYYDASSVDESEEYYEVTTSADSDGGGGGGGGGRGGGGGKVRAKSVTKPRAEPPPADYAKSVPPQGGVYTGSSSPAPQRQYQNTAEAERRVKEVAKMLKANRQSIVIQGYANGADADHRALDLANTMRNRLIDEGVPPAQLSVEAKRDERPNAAGVRLVADAGGGAAGAPIDEIETPVGESHFTSSRPMSVKRASSVMVSIVRTNTDGEVVYLYDPESARGNSKFAFRAIRFKNPTDNTLETGPLTVYGEGRFIGEGLSEPIPPRATAVVPFALDRQVIVVPEENKRDRIDSLVTLQRGILTANVQHVRTTSLKVTNRLRRKVTMFVRHTVDKGWKLGKAPETYEQLGDSHLFMVELGGGETQSIEIEETTPMVKTVDLRSDVGLDMVKLYLEAESVDPAFAAEMQKLLTLRKQLADHEQTMGSIRQRLSDYRERMDELHAQLVTLEAVKSKGELMTHLKQKMKDISERVQKSTIELVDLEEKAMTTRIRFQDGVAELTLADRLQATGSGLQEKPETTR